DRTYNLSGYESHLADAIRDDGADGSRDHHVGRTASAVAARQAGDGHGWDDTKCANDPSRRSVRHERQLSIGVRRHRVWFQREIVVAAGEPVADLVVVVRAAGMPRFAAGVDRPQAAVRISEV